MRNVSLGHASGPYTVTTTQYSYCGIESNSETSLKDASHATVVSDTTFPLNADGWTTAGTSVSPVV